MLNNYNPPPNRAGIFFKYFVEKIKTSLKDNQLVDRSKYYFVYICLCRVNKKC